MQVPALMDIKALEQWYRMNKGEELHGVLQGTQHDQSAIFQYYVC